MKAPVRLLVGLLFVLTLFSNAGLARAGSRDVELSGHLGADATVVRLRGSYAYTAFGSELAVLDLSDPAHPLRAGYIMAAGEVQDLAIAGRYAYLAYRYDDTSGFAGVGPVGPAGLQIIDLRDPANPLVVGALELESSCAFNPRLTAGGGYVYLGITLCSRFGGIIQNAGARLFAVNVSDPGRPQVAGSYNITLFSSIGGLALSGNYLHVSMSRDSGGLLSVFDIADPTDLSLAGEAMLPAIPQGLALAGSTAYLAAGSSGLLVVDITSPAAPVPVTTLALPGQARSVALAGEYALVAAGSAGVRVVDISTPAAPFEAGSFAAPFAWDAWASGETAAVAAGSGGLQVLAADLPQLSLAGSLKYPPRPRDLAVAGPYAYAAASDGLWVLDVADPCVPAVAAYLALSGNPVALVLNDGFAYVADSTAGLHVVDIANPLAPVAAGFVSLPGTPHQLELAGTRLYVAAGSAGLRILDTGAPALPAEIGFFQVDQASVIDVSMAGNYAFLAMQEGSLRAVRVTNPAAPLEVGRYDPPGYLYPSLSATSVTVAGDRAYLTTISPPPTPLAGFYSGALWIVDVADPQELGHLGQFWPGGAPSQVAVVGDLAFLAAERAGLRVLDVSDPQAVALSGFYDPSGYFDGLTLSGEQVYLYNRSFFILRYADPALPTIQGQAAHPNRTPFRGLPISAGSGRKAFSDAHGSFRFGGLAPATYTLTPTLGGVAFAPSQRTVTVPPSAYAQNFTVLAAPVSVPLVPGVQASLVYTDTQGLPTQLEIPAAAVAAPSTLHLVPSPGAGAPGYDFTGHAFSLAVEQAGGEQPVFRFAAPLRVTISYSPADTRTISDLAALVLWWWDGQGWADAATTCQPSAVYTRDLQSGTVSLDICQSGSFQLVGPTYQSYLTFVYK